MRHGGACAWAVALLVGSTSGCADANQCKHRDEYSIELSGEEPASTALTEQFWQVHLDEIHAIDGVHQSGVDACCEGWGETSSECLGLGVLRFGATRDELTDALRAIQRSDPVAARHELLITVKVSGPAGPRCSPGQCGPIPFLSLGTERTPPAKSTAGRVLVEPPSTDGPDCRPDGECLPSGCTCMHWKAGGQACAGVGSVRDTSFCGSVESRCALFF